jgi:hypothetical protein
MHLLQGARVARENGLGEKVIMVCLLHDIAIAGLLSADHGYRRAQLVAPYVDQEVLLGHREARGAALLPGESLAYTCPAAYLGHFGPDYARPSTSAGSTRQRAGIAGE